MRLRKRQKSPIPVPVTAISTEQTRTSITEALDELAKTGRRLGEVIETFNQIKTASERARQEITQDLTPYRRLA